MKYRKKPVVIDALHWDGQNISQLESFMQDTERTVAVTNGHATISTLEGMMRAAPDDWIIRGIQGEYYPCKPDIFEKTYEPV